MPIDASIPLQVQPVKTVDPRELYSFKAQMDQNALANQLGQLQLQNAQRQSERQNKLADLLSQQYAKPEERESALMQGGFLDEATKLGKDRRENAKVDAETSASQFKLAHEKAMAFANLAGSVRDQNSYNQALQTAKSMGLDISSAPAQYDPRFVQNFGNQALTQAQRIEQEWKNRTASESERHNRASEGIQIRGQNMTDAREKEKNQIARDSKPLTDSQAKSAAFGARMQSANETLNSLEADGKLFSTPGSRTGFGVGAVVNTMNSAKGQQLDQAKRDFINAVLRRESGAVIAESEFENAEKQYFPQIGDSQEVIAQKRRNREIATRGVLAEVPKEKTGVVGEIVGSSGKDLGGGFRIK